MKGVAALVVSVAALAQAAGGAAAELPRRRPAEAEAATPVPEPAGDRVRGDPEHAAEPALMSPEAEPVDYDPALFGPDPVHALEPYDVEAQLAIYGGKRRIDAPRPPIEWGYPMYETGPIGPGINLFGDKNPARPQLLVFGDLRLATAYNDNGAAESGQVAARLNLNVDLRLTATERIHLFLRPFDRVESGRSTNYQFTGDGPDDEDLLFDLTPEALFFEGDLGQIATGLTGEYQHFDLPIAFGLTPLVFQNGVWMEDAVLGGAFSIAARNSPRFDISNMDVTFFAGFDRVTTGALRKVNGRPDDHGGQVYGAAVFVEAAQAYFEGGYAYTNDTASDAAGDFSYHNVTVAVTRRWFGKLSNSIRIIGNFGQDPGAGIGRTADGAIVLIENSWITSKPYTLVPYANFFAGIDRPQSLARDFGAGGILENTGINFETDGLTGFPKLDDTAHDTFGGAVGIEYLFALDRQLVVEVAGLEPFGRGGDSGRTAKGSQAALGFRFQQPLSKSWLLRFDAIYGPRERESDLGGVRVELRLKF